MRTIVNISLPASLAKSVKQSVREGGYSSTSEFIRHLIRLWNTRRLAAQIRRDDAAFARGEGKVLRSLKDLM